MRLRCFVLLLLVIPSLMRAAEDPGEEFSLLQIDKQQAMPLSYFIRHAPSNVIDAPDEAAKFERLPEGISAHLTEVGYLMGHQLFAIRYLADARLDHGNDMAVGLVLLCKVQDSPTRFAPIISIFNEDEGVVDDYSVSAILELGGSSFVFVRRSYSGTANSTERTVITAPDANSPLQTYSLFADTDPLAELKEQGWEPWHRGNHFSEDTLTWHFHLYRDPAKATEKDEFPHRHVRVRYTFRDGKLHPEKPETEE